jgi:hypothetical protein
MFLFSMFRMQRLLEKVRVWAILLLFFPSVVFAQPGVLEGAAVTARATPLGRIFVVVGGLIATAIPIVVALALLAFFWGMAMYIFNTGNDEQRKKGLQIMIWGIIALFVMVSVWGIIAVIRNTFLSTGTASTTNNPLGGSI